MISTSPRDTLCMRGGGSKEMIIFLQLSPCGSSCFKVDCNPL